MKKSEVILRSKNERGSEIVEEYELATLDYNDSGKRIVETVQAKEVKMEGLSSTVDLTQEQADKWGKDIIDWFNRGLRPGESSRTFIDIKIVD